MNAFQLRDYQVNCSNQVFEAWKTHKSVLISLPTGAGKCLGKGTPVLMFDGTIRRVEDVMVGELLMGPDSLPREVLSTCSGWEKMFRVTPVKGEPYTVNKSHILSLKITGLPAKSTGSGGGLCTGMIVNVNVADYLQRSKSFKHIAKGYRVGVDFSPKPCSLPPYFLGLWLGDGTSSRPEITTPDQEVKDYIKSLCETEGLRFVEKAQKDNLSSVCSLSGPITGRSKNKRNRILEELRVLGLVGNKHIPAIYKHNSREVRLEILAGLMDSDGHQHNGGFDYISIRERLSNDVAYLARSLGLAAYVSRCRKVCSNNGAVGTYFRVSVSGDCSQIPVRIPRKKATARKQKKDVLMTGIKSCESVGNGQYFGFTITGDGLFLLGDFTVTHNTIIFADVIKRLQPKRSFVVAHREELIRQAQQKIENTTGLECGIEMANERVSSHPRISGFGLPVVIGTVQTLNAQFGDRKRMSKFDPMDFGALIIDECVPPETLVDGRPIRNIRKGDLVRCYDGNSFVMRPVMRVFKSKPRLISEVKFSSGKTFTCTPGHPLFTQRGWVNAYELTPCDVVLSCRDDNQLQKLRTGSYSHQQIPLRQAQGWVGDLLFSEMLQRVLQEDISQKHGCYQPEICFCQDESEQSYAAGFSSRQGLHEVAHHGMETPGQAREWPSSNNSATSYCGSVGMGNGGRYPNRSSPARWIRFPDMLQSRCWLQGAQVWRGSRWEFSRHAHQKETGYQEANPFGWDRVDSVEVYQRGSGQGFSRLCPEGVVYNIEVAEHHNYIAEGYLVHNCHRSTARSYRNVINYFQQNPELRVLGCSATPVRHDQEALSQVFGSVAYDYSILDGIKDGWLCDITQQFSTVAGLDYSHIRTTAGDLNGADLAAVMEAESNIVGVCQPSLEVLFGIPPHTLDQTPVPQWGEYLRSLNRPARRAIVFTASVLQAELCCNIFNRVIPGMSDWVCGETNKEKRKKILDDFASGALRVVMNCAVLTEGYDNPFVEVVIMAHPTKSAGRYQQMVGRSCRPLPGVVDHPDMNTPDKRVAAIAASQKPFCRIVDFVGNSGKHRLVSCMDILGGKVSDDARQFAINKATKEGKPVRVSRVLDKAEIQLQEEKQKQAEERRRQEAARKAHLVARSKFSMQDVDAFGKFNSHNATPMRDGHRQRPPTEKMARLLRRNGVNPDKLSFAQAGAIIGKWIAQWKGNNGNGKKK